MNTNKDSAHQAPEQETSTSETQIFDDLVSELPDVQQHAIDLEQSKRDEAESAINEVRTEYPDFDPAIHKVDATGKPVLTKTGQLAKKRGRKTTETRSVIGKKAEAQPTPDNTPAVTARATGRMAANLLMTLGVVVGGEEWRPMQDAATGIDEKTMLETAFSDYFEATGKTDLPPALALTVAIGGYALPRFTMPKTRSRLGKIKDWFVKKWVDRKLKKHGLKSEKADD